MEEVRCVWTGDGEVRAGGRTLREGMGSDRAQRLVVVRRRKGRCVSTPLKAQWLVRSLTAAAVLSSGCGSASSSLLAGWGLGFRV